MRTFPSLLISPSAQDHVFLRNVFESLGRRLLTACSRAEAQPLLDCPGLSLILTERDLPDGSWKDVLAEAESRRPAPLVIVTSRLADDRLWAEVLNLGGYDVLAKPLDAQEAVRVLNLAWHHRPHLDAAAAGHRAA